MYRKILIITLLVFALGDNIYSQNIIKNGSFESYSSLPTDVSQIHKAKDWYPISITADLFVYPDFYNIIPTYGNAHSGMGLWASDPSFVTTESMGQQLETPLEAGKQYYLKFYVADANFFGQYCVNVQVYGFPDRPFKMNEPFNHIERQRGATLLGETPVIKETTFEVFEMCFSPDKKLNHIAFTVNRGACDQYVYLDAIELYELEEQKLFADEGIICKDQRIQLGVDIQDAAYHWQDGSTEPFFTVTEPGTYWVGIDTVCNLELRDSIEILDGRINLPDEFLPADTTLCDDEILELIIPASDTASYEYLWSHGAMDKDVMIEESGIYQAFVSRLSCTSVDDIEVTFNSCKPCQLYIPNIFSPNDDGNNDVFQVFPNCPILDYRIVVMDRWGSEVFASTDINETWTAKTGRYDETVPLGIYTYFIEYSGEEFGEIARDVISGSIAVVR